MFRRSVLICALAFCAPVLWGALVEQDVSLEAAGIRFLIALPVAGVLVWLVRVAATHQNSDGDSGDGSSVSDTGAARRSSPPLR